MERRKIRIRPRPGLFDIPNRGVHKFPLAKCSLIFSPCLIGGFFPLPKRRRNIGHDLAHLGQAFRFQEDASGDRLVCELRIPNHDQSPVASTECLRKKTDQLAPEQLDPFQSATLSGQFPLRLNSVGSAGVHQKTRRRTLVSESHDQEFQWVGGEGAMSDQPADYGWLEPDSR